jgi:Amt family ammonium transporter
VFNGFFAEGSVIALDGVNTTIPGGFMDRNWKQLYVQLAYIVATCAYTFVVTALIAKGVDSIPGLRLRATLEEETLGMDDVDVSAHLYLQIAL